MLDLTEKNFKIPIKSPFRELKESVVKEVKKDMITMSHDTETINKAIEIIKKKKSN